jgi:hypothetical protein
MSWRKRVGVKDPWHAGDDPWKSTTASSSDKNKATHYVSSSAALIFEQMVCRIGTAFRLDNADLFLLECHEYDAEIVQVAQLLRACGKRWKPNQNNSKDAEVLLDLLAMLALPQTTGVPQIQYVTVEVEKKATPKADAESQVGLATSVNEIAVGGEVVGAEYIEKEIVKEVEKLVEKIVEVPRSEYIEKEVVKEVEKLVEKSMEGPRTEYFKKETVKQVEKLVETIVKIPRTLQHPSCAAVTLQAWLRGRRARRAVLAHRLNVTNATVKIQSMYRGLRTRRRTEVQKTLQHCAKEFKAMLDETNKQLIDQ